MSDLEAPRYQRMIEDELEKTLSWLKMIPSESEEYMKVLTIVERLEKMIEKKEKRSSVSKEVIVTAGANLLGILMIIKHESVNVITSKALSFVPRLRI